MTEECFRPGTGGILMRLAGEVMMLVPNPLVVHECRQPPLGAKRCPPELATPFFVHHRIMYPFLRAND
jgi:hypothetical protein